MMVNGRIARAMSAAELAADGDCSIACWASAGMKRRRRKTRRSRPPSVAVRDARLCGQARREPAEAYAAAHAAEIVYSSATAPTRGRPAIRWPKPRERHCAAQRRSTKRRAIAELHTIPVAARAGRAAYVAGTFDTKGRELFFIRDLPGAARHPHGDGRPRDLGQAVAGDRPPARGRAPSSARRGAPSSPATAARR